MEVMWKEKKKKKLKCEQIWRLIHGGYWLVSFIKELYFKSIIRYRKSDDDE